MKTVPLITAFRDLEKYISRNSPSILTGLGIGLGVASTILAVGATPKAVRLLEMKKKEDRKEKLAYFGGDIHSDAVPMLRYVLLDHHPWQSNNNRRLIHTLAPCVRL